MPVCVSIYCEDCNQRRASHGLPPSRKKRWCCKCRKSHHGAMALRDPTYHLANVSPVSPLSPGLPALRSTASATASHHRCGNVLAIHQGLSSVVVFADRGLSVVSVQDDPTVVAIELKKAEKFSGSIEKVAIEIETKYSEKV